MTSTLCEKCKISIPSSFLVCPSCHALVYATRLTELSARAVDHQKKDLLPDALQCWREVLDLLPSASVQYKTVQEKIVQLSKKVDALPRQKRKPQIDKKKWGYIIGGIGVGIGILSKFKFLFGFLVTKLKFLLAGLTKMNTLFSMFLSLGVYWAAWGWLFAAGIIVSIYIHEMGHVAMLKKYGINASAPMFIPGFGAVVRMNQYPQTETEEARVGLAGPLWGLGAALLSLGLYLIFKHPYWLAIAKTGAWINLFNLLPIRPLDGGRGFQVMTRIQKWVLLGFTFLCWAWTKEGLLILILLVGIFGSLHGTPKEKSDSWSFAIFLLLITSLSALTLLPDGMGLP